MYLQTHKSKFALQNCFKKA